MFGPFTGKGRPEVGVLVLSWQGSARDNVNSRRNTYVYRYPHMYSTGRCLCTFFIVRNIRCGMSQSVFPGKATNEGNVFKIKSLSSVLPLPFEHHMMFSWQSIFLLLKAAFLVGLSFSPDFLEEDCTKKNAVLAVKGLNINMQHVLL